MKKEIIYTILSILFMSLGPTINKFALKDVSPMTLVFYNAFLCCLFTFPLVYKKLLAVNKQEVKALIFAGLLNGLSMYFLFYGLNKSSPALVSMLNRSYILFSILLGAYVLKESIQRIDWALIVFATLGIILFMFKKEMSLVDGAALLGLISGLLFSLCNFIIKNKLHKTSEYIILFSINFISAFIFFFICLLDGIDTIYIPLDIKVVSFIVLGSFLGSFLGLLLFYASIKKIPFYKANLYRSVSPVVSLIIGLAFFPVFLSTTNIIGLVILLSAFIIHSIIKVKNMESSSNLKKVIQNLECFKTDVLPETYKTVLVIIKKEKEWLMVKNKFRSWEFPGGHIENNETAYETARREAFEEAGVDIKNMTYVGYYQLASGHTTLIITAEVETFHEIPTDFETEERKFVIEFPASLSFNDAVYPWLIKNFI